MRPRYFVYADMRYVAAAASAAVAWLRCPMRACRAAIIRGALFVVCCLILRRCRRERYDDERERELLIFFTRTIIFRALMATRGDTHAAHDMSPCFDAALGLPR